MCYHIQEMVQNFKAETGGRPSSAGDRAGGTVHYRSFLAHLTEHDPALQAQVHMPPKQAHHYYAAGSSHTNLSHSNLSTSGLDGLEANSADARPLHQIVMQHQPSFHYTRASALNIGSNQPNGYSPSKRALAGSVSASPTKGPLSAVSSSLPALPSPSRNARPGGLPQLQSAPAAPPSHQRLSPMRMSHERQPAMSNPGIAPSVVDSSVPRLPTLGQLPKVPSQAHLPSTNSNSPARATRQSIASSTGLAMPMQPPQGPPAGMLNGSPSRFAKIVPPPGPPGTAMGGGPPGTAANRGMLPRLGQGPDPRMPDGSGLPHGRQLQLPSRALRSSALAGAGSPAKHAVGSPMASASPTKSIMVTVAAH